MRHYRCVDCPADADEYEAGDKGRLPVRCPGHRRARATRLERRRRSGLTVVPDDAPVAVPDPQAREDAAVLGLPAAPALLADIVRADLDALVSKHPARDTLVALAIRLAEAADSPAVLVADPRALPPLVRELRATVRDLLEREEADDGDLFGDDTDLPTALVDSAAG